jgi:LysR family hydrogen peroxide-inducible transcriptional activator
MSISIFSMNIHQFKYLLAVAELKHFELAAEKCFVTQSTLSTMIAKFEEELGVAVFDRKKKPVEITAEGVLVLRRLKHIVHEIDGMKEMVKELKGEVSGQITISVIPTVAPFLLPLFLQEFARDFPSLHISVREQTTQEIVRGLKNRDIDLGILSVPLNEPELIEQVVYDEPFLFYDAGRKRHHKIKVEDAADSNLCLLEEGHCMRTQVLSLCDIKEGAMASGLQFDFKAGSIDSLMRFVKANKATTLLPYLATHNMSHQDKKHLSEFKGSIPYRTIGIAVHRHFIKKKILTSLITAIQKQTENILPKLKGSKNRLLPVEHF